MNKLDNVLKLTTLAKSCFFTITLTHYDSIPFRQTLCMCLLYYLLVSGGKEKGSFPSLSIYLGSYYTIEMIGSRYKSLEVYTKPWTQECAEETQILSYRKERREKSLVVVTFLCMANVNWIVRGWFNLKSDKLPLAKDKISPKNCKKVKKRSYCFKTISTQSQQRFWILHQQERNWWQRWNERLGSRRIFGLCFDFSYNFSYDKLASKSTR